jgi:predicted nucleic acid-binding Zn ribbon protein
VGALATFSSCESLSKVIPATQRRLTAMTLILYLLFTLIASWRMLSTSFRL